MFCYFFTVVRKMQQVYLKTCYKNVFKFKMFIRLYLYKTHTLFIIMGRMFIDFFKSFFIHLHVSFLSLDLLNHCITYAVYHQIIYQQMYYY